MISLSLSLDILSISAASQCGALAGSEAWAHTDPHGHLFVRNRPGFCCCHGISQWQHTNPCSTSFKAAAAAGQVVSIRSCARQGWQCAEWTHDGTCGRARCGNEDEASTRVCHEKMDRTRSQAGGYGSLGSSSRSTSSARSVCNVGESSRYGRLIRICQHSVSVLRDRLH